MDGLLLIDKPPGMTSHDVVDAIRQRFKIRRVGHGGTLDPAATGLLVLLVGRATRGARRFLGAQKVYQATLRLGQTTDTQDGQGRILRTRPVGEISLADLEAVCEGFRGEIEQTVPVYSAIRIGGRRSYELARAGVAVPPIKKRVTIYELKMLAVRLPEVDLQVTCSKGTYIRALCADIGEKLGVGAHLSRLRRIQIGPWSVDQAVKLEEVGPQSLLPLTESA